GVKMIDNLVGTDLMPFFFVNTMDRRYRYFLLGARGDVVERAAEYLVRQFPGLCIVGYHHGHYDQDEHDGVLERINAARPEVLLVGMGNPIQECWIHDNRPRLTKVRLAVGVGGLFDHWGGVLKRAPRWVRRNGFEWAQLMLQQPHKWRRYLWGIRSFSCDARAICSAVGTTVTRRRNEPAADGSPVAREEDGARHDGAAVVDVGRALLPPALREVAARPGADVPPLPRRPARSVQRLAGGVRPADALALGAPPRRVRRRLRRVPARTA